MSAIRAKQMTKEMVDAERQARLLVGLEQPEMTEEQKRARLEEIRRANDDVRDRAAEVARRKAREG